MIFLMVRLRLKALMLPKLIHMSIVLMTNPLTRRTASISMLRDIMFVIK